MLSPTDFHDIVSGRRNDLVARMLRPCLSIAEVPYRSVVQLRNYRFDTQADLSTRMPVPVISVGNLSMGGTGKTPLVCWLAEWFQQQLVQVAIVSRGYGAKDGQMNDEALELRQRLPHVPHIQNPNRVVAASQAIKQGAELILLDDGFQHRRIERDLNLALIDATDPFGCGHVFPRGMLREPMTGIRRADVVCLTRCDLVSEAELSAIEMRYRRLNEQALFLRLCHRPCRWINSAGRALPLDAMQGRSVAAFCALGNPDAFRKTLESCGCQVKRFHTFPDHHHLSESDVATLAQNAAEDDVDFVVCSHKDLVKLDREQVGEKQVFALQIEIDFASKRDELLQTLARVLDQVRSGAGKRLE